MIFIVDTPVRTRSKNVLIQIIEIKLVPYETNLLCAYSTIHDSRILHFIRVLMLLRTYLIFRIYL